MCVLTFALSGRRRRSALERVVRRRLAPRHDGAPDSGALECVQVCPRTISASTRKSLAKVFRRYPWGSGTADVQFDRELPLGLARRGSVPQVPRRKELDSSVQVLGNSTVELVSAKCDVQDLSSAPKS